MGLGGFGGAGVWGCGTQDMLFKQIYSLIFVFDQCASRFITHVKSRGMCVSVCVWWWWWGAGDVLEGGGRRRGRVGGAGVQGVGGGLDMRKENILTDKNQFLLALSKNTINMSISPPNLLILYKHICTYTSPPWSYSGPSRPPLVLPVKRQAFPCVL